ncbi:MAG: dicarboxylate/amino acid:cation symporter, partial [Planctomycetes bacterium]|nr:dicarboxylate/amino acid:cation symporter [Planctomycetota bacterium]
MLRPWQWPMYLRVVAGVVIGTIIGSRFRTEAILLGASTQELATIAGLYIQLLTALATPLIFFAILDAFVQTHISGWQGAKMFAICGLNVVVAFAIGLTIINVWQPGKVWQGSLASRASEVTAPSSLPSGSSSSSTSAAKSKDLTESAKKSSLSPLDILRSYVPKSVAQPFTDNMVLTVSALAILIGAAMRSVKSTADEELMTATQTFERLVVVSYQILLKLLGWIIELAPWAICFAVAGVVGSTGPRVFQLVGVFFVTIVVALSVHSLVYYLLSAWLIGGKSPRDFLREGITAILTGFSINSSLATAPLTLVALKRLNVSDSSARLSACVGTNFNNDGITLYEAITALFIAQAAGMTLSVNDQIAILLAALSGSLGIAGIPNSGLIILALVLKAARLPEETVQ